MRKKLIPLIIVLCLLLSGCGHELASYRPIGDVNDMGFFVLSIFKKLSNF